MPSRKIHKVLIAGRGEIAVRVMRTLKKLSINSVAIYADNDADALHRRMADEARPLGNGTLKDTYLNIQKIIDAALDTGADAIHPGYGFLSESPELAEACANNNIIFIGPDADTMRLMGNKIAAREFAKSHGIPVTTGVTGTMDDIMRQAEDSLRNSLETIQSAHTSVKSVNGSGRAVSAPAVPRREREKEVREDDFITLQ